LSVIATLIVLSELGVDIGPLIAGAGVIGIAIGFGLADDAFRVGEYIDVGDVMGTVEHISIRSLRLRHHRGPVHTIPFGEIRHLTNFSRDWAIMKIEFRLPFDADLEKVRKIIKKVGQTLMADPVHGFRFYHPGQVHDQTRRAVHLAPGGIQHDPGGLRQSGNPLCAPEGHCGERRGTGRRGSRRGGRGGGPAGLVSVFGNLGQTVQVR
jgi:hypothetical protein